MSSVSAESRPVSTISEWSDYNLRWLFDPDRYDHLPIEEQVKLFKQNDLKKTKTYKFAVQIWGGPRSRKRVMVAKPSERLSPIPYTDNKQYGQNTNISPQHHVVPAITPEEPKALQRAREEKKKIDNYREWINNRKEFRKNLDDMGIQIDWLSRKPDKTPLEQRVLTRMIEESTRRAPTPPPPEEEPATPVMSEVSPTVRRPSPQAIKIFEKFLQRKKMRLIDLFQTFDKDKSWTVTRKEFKDAIKHYKVPISEALLEDLILTLDTDMNDVLDYRELANGMGIWKLEKRESKREMITSGEVRSSPAKFSKVNGFDPPADVENATENEVKVQPRVNSSSSTRSSLLEPPDPDTRPEQLVLSSDEAMMDMRKQNKAVLNNYDKKKKHIENSIVKTMDVAADKHLLPTTLTGETADLLHKFRQLKFREYQDACELCEERGVPLTETLLQRVLLYPSDKLHPQLKKNIRQPANPLIPKDFHEGKEIESFDKKNIKRSSVTSTTKTSTSPVNNHRHSPNEKLMKNYGTQNQHQSPITRNMKGRNANQAKNHGKGTQMAYTRGPTQTSPRAKAKKTPMVDSRQAYMSSAAIGSSPSKQNLSTGKALISRKVDCWLTFEEYDKLTSQGGGQPLRPGGKSDDNAFWPGQLLDKLRLYLPEAQAPPKAAAVFTVVPNRF